MNCVSLVQYRANHCNRGDEIFSVTKMKNLEDSSLPECVRRVIGNYLPVYMAYHSRRLASPATPLRESNISPRRNSAHHLLKENSGIIVSNLGSCPTLICHRPPCNAIALTLLHVITSTVL
jgi:hypothetical protein